MSASPVDVYLRAVVNLFPRRTSFEPYVTLTATLGLMLGIRVGTTPLDLNAETTGPAGTPCSWQLVLRLSTGVATSSTGVGAAQAAEALKRSERIVEYFIVLDFGMVILGYFSRRYSTRPRVSSYKSTLTLLAHRIIKFRELAKAMWLRLPCSSRRFLGLPLALVTDRVPVHHHEFIGISSLLEASGL